VKTPSKLNNSGVYSILNKQNNKIYIGSSKNIRKRWKCHRNMLRNNKHNNEHLQFAYNKYGADSFEWNVLEYCSLNELVVCEQKWINNFDAANRLKGFNKRPLANSFIGYKHSEKTKLKMRKAHLGEKHPEWRREITRQVRYKKVYQFDLNGVFIADFKSLIEAEQKTQISRQLISGCCRKITKSAKGFIWSFNKSVQPRINKLNKEIQWIDGVIYPSIKEASRVLNISRATIYRKLHK
jgi:hypothetical protein